MPQLWRRVNSKCGEVKVNHWAHKGMRNCDPWWENETEWHRSWKGKFPIEWQEVIQYDQSGEKHIADVKTGGDWVLEFQHSYLNPEERRSRNAFYPKLVWVIDGTKRKTDKSQFQRIFDDSTTVIREPLIKRVRHSDECRLLKEWNNCNALVFFDFEEVNNPEQSHLWFLFPKITSSDTYLSPFSRIDFIDLHNDNKFDELVQNIILPIQNELDGNKQTQTQNELNRRPNIPSETHRRMARARMKGRLQII